MHLELDENAERLDKDAQGMIFYVVEEAVGNARKHAQATDIWISSTRDNDDLSDRSASTTARASTWAKCRPTTTSAAAWAWST